MVFVFWCNGVLDCVSSYHSHVRLNCCGATVHDSSGCLSQFDWPLMIRYFLIALLQAYYHVFGLGWVCLGQSCLDALKLLLSSEFLLLPQANSFMWMPFGLAMSAMVVACRYILHRFILIVYSFELPVMASMMHWSFSLSSCGSHPVVSFI